MRCKICVHCRLQSHLRSSTVLFVTSLLGATGAAYIRVAPLAASQQRGTHQTSNIAGGGGAMFSWEIHKPLSAQKPAHARCMLNFSPKHFTTSAQRRSCTVQEDLADQDRPQTLHAPRPDSACTANNPSGHHRRASSDTRSKILGMPDCRGA